MWPSLQNILNVDARALMGIVPGRAPGLIRPVDAPASAHVQQRQGDVLVTVRGEHERHGAVMVAGVDVDALADQLLDLVGFQSRPSRAWTSRFSLWWCGRRNWDRAFLHERVSGAKLAHINDAITASINAQFGDGGIGESSSPPGKTLLDLNTPLTFPPFGYGYGSPNT